MGRYLPFTLRTSPDVGHEAIARRRAGLIKKVPMLVRLLYVSRAVGPQTTFVTGSILSSAKVHNASHDISGVLCQGQGLYLQVLEGERAAVNQLYARIMADPRHRDVEMLHLEEITQRRFKAWAMAHVDLSEHDPMIRMKHPEFDPYSASGAIAMQLMDDLLSSGQPVSFPLA